MRNGSAREGIGNVTKTYIAWEGMRDPRANAVTWRFWGTFSDKQSALKDVKGRLTYWRISECTHVADSGNTAP
jgi:hypothetical protein